MIIERLPAYTSERYYLLSELEQVVEFTDLLSKKANKNDTVDGILRMVYMIWNAAGTINEDNLTVLDTLVENGQKFIVFIEALDSSSSASDTIIACLDSLERRYQGCCIIIGVGNKVSCTAAIDRCLEIVQKSKLIILASHTITLATLDPDDLLGHDVTREPDAESDVQVTLQCHILSYVICVVMNITLTLLYSKLSI